MSKSALLVLDLVNELVHEDGKFAGMGYPAQVKERGVLEAASSAIGKARAVFRSDLFRAHLGPAGAEIPGASDKLEGSLDRPVVVAARSGHLILAPDAFFDGAIFDPGAER